MDHILLALPRHLDLTRTAPAASDLPACIEQVARQLGAFYNPTREMARTNLHADAFSVRAYLGTYLPRTVFEFMTIASEILVHAPMRNALPAQRPLRILDLGSGTGGAWMGLVTALCGHGFKQGFRIDAVDGNATALGVQPAFAQAIATVNGVAIDLNTLQRNLGLSVDAFTHDLQSVLAELQGQYDFVLVSKHLSEFYCSAGKAAHGVVQQSLQWLGNALTPNGFLVLLDVTTRIDEVGEYFPNLMARELGGYMAQNPAGLLPVLPVPCAVSAQGGCAGGRGQCYTQRHLHFQHCMTSATHPRRESTKVTYRVLTGQSLARRIAAGYACNLAYHVNAQRDDEVCHRGRIVPHMRGFNGYLTPIQQAA